MSESRRREVRALLEMFSEMHQAILNKLRKAAKTGSDSEPILDSAFDSLDAPRLEFLDRYLDDVYIWLDPKKKRTWDHPNAIICIGDGDIFIRLPVKVLKKPENRELAERVQKKMSTITIDNNGTIRSLRNPALPMDYPELYELRKVYTNRLYAPSEIDNQVAQILWGKTLGKMHAVGFWKLFEECGLPLSEVVILPGADEENHRKAARLAIARFYTPGDAQHDFFRDIFNAELAKYIQERRAKRVACHVRLTKELNFYSVIVTDPKGNDFSITNTGFDGALPWLYTPTNWTKADHTLLICDAAGEPPDGVDFVPYVKAYRMDERELRVPMNVPVDVVEMYDDPATRHWVLYLPSREWKVRGSGIQNHHRPMKASTHNATISYES